MRSPWCIETPIAVVSSTKRPVCMAGPCASVSPLRDCAGGRGRSVTEPLLPSKCWEEAFLREHPRLWAGASCLPPAWIYTQVKGPLASLVAQLVKNPPAIQETAVQFLGRKDPLEEGMAPHPSVLAGESRGQRSLAGCSPWGRKEWDTTECLSTSWGHVPHRHVCIFGT